MFTFPLDPAAAERLGEVIPAALDWLRARLRGEPADRAPTSLRPLLADISRL